MNDAMIWLGANALVAFLFGTSFGYWLALKCVRKHREQEQAEMRSLCQAMEDCVTKQHQWMQSLSDGVQALAKQRTPMLVDWSVLTSAANGAGFTLVKAEPHAAERTH